jgi:hypothetical protein
MTKDISIIDYIHLYLGCDCEFFIGLPEGFSAIGEITSLDVRVLHNVLNVLATCKPILRPLRDMTKAEMEECGNMIYDFSDDEELNKWEWQNFEIGLAPEQFKWLLDRHFDLFGLIEAGAALDKTTLKQNR